MRDAATRAHGRGLDGVLRPELAQPVCYRRPRWLIVCQGHSLLGDRPSFNMAAQYHESLRGDLADTAADTDREPCQVEEDGMARHLFEEPNPTVSTRAECLIVPVTSTWTRGGERGATLRVLRKAIATRVGGQGGRRRRTRKDIGSRILYIKHFVLIVQGCCLHPFCHTNSFGWGHGVKPQVEGFRALGQRQGPTALIP